MPTCINRLKSGAQLVDYWVTIYVHPFKRESMKQRAKRGTPINPNVIDLFCHTLPITQSASSNYKPLNPEFMRLNSFLKLKTNHT